MDNKCSRAIVHVNAMSMSKKENSIYANVRDYTKKIKRAEVCHPRETMVKMNIENVVASASMERELDLNAIEEALDGATYNPKQFPGLVYRLKEPKTATLLFRSGKLVCTGAKDLSSVRTAVNRVADDLRKAGIEINVEPKVEVQNIVASSDLEENFNLTSVVITLGMEKVEYEPEQFPGLVYRLDDPKTVILLFGSGRMVCTGAKTPEDVVRSVERIARDLTEAGLMHRRHDRNPHTEA